MSQQRQSRPARSRTLRPVTRTPRRASEPAIPPTPATEGEPVSTPAPEIMVAGDEHGWIAIGMMLFGMAIVAFLAILIAMAAG